MTDHTTECEAARAGHFFTQETDDLGRVLDLRPDPYPTMSDLTEEGRAAVLACPSGVHDVVRLFCQVTLP